MPESPATPHVATDATALTPISRRELLRGGVALGVSVVAARGVGTPRAFAAARRHSQLVLDYRPQQPTGWPGTPGRSFAETIGGHRAFQDFTVEGTRYRISLLGFRNAADRPDPIYEGVPADREIAFKQTLAKGFGSHYAFRYLGGFEGGNELSVQSYSVFVDPPTTTSPQALFGADLYLGYTPDPRSSDPPIDDRLQWIQVVRAVAPGMPPQTQVDNLWRANPYYLYGGETSINGRAVANFHDLPQTAVQAVQGGVRASQRFTAEAFLAQDTGRKDRAGRGIVNVMGGVKWGWKVEQLRG
jgi:hypothetical protein